MMRSEVYEKIVQLKFWGYSFLLENNLAHFSLVLKAIPETKDVSPKAKAAGILSFGTPPAFGRDETSPFAEGYYCTDDTPGKTSVYTSESNANFPLE